MSQHKITQSDVSGIAQLARIYLTQSEIYKLQNNLSDILEYIGQLREVPTSQLAPTTQVTGLYNIYRPDNEIPEQQLKQGQALMNAPSQKNGHLKVKSVF